MDSDTLLCCLKIVLEKTAVKKWIVVPRDYTRLVDFSQLPLALVVNCSDSNTRGSHWIGFYVYRVKNLIYGDYFDSYNNPLSKYNIVPPFIIRDSSSKVLQSYTSSVCALYVLMYFYWKSRGNSIKLIEFRFTRNLDSNDCKIRYLYKTLIKVNRKKSKTLSCCARFVNKL
jgi:hypothetical protein